MWLLNQTVSRINIWEKKEKKKINITKNSYISLVPKTSLCFVFSFIFYGSRVVFVASALFIYIFFWLFFLFLSWMNYTQFFSWMDQKYPISLHLDFPHSWSNKQRKHFVKTIVIRNTVLIVNSINFHFFSCQSFRFCLEIVFFFSCVVCSSILPQHNLGYLLKFRDPNELIFQFAIRVCVCVCVLSLVASGRQKKGVQ